MEMKLTTNEHKVICFSVPTFGTAELLCLSMFVSFSMFQLRYATLRLRLRQAGRDAFVVHARAEVGALFDS